MSNAAAFKRCLPALQQLARFPGADFAYVCRKRCMDQNDVTAARRGALEDIGGVSWNEETLEEAAKLYGVTLLDLDYKLAPAPAREPARPIISLEVAEPKDPQKPVVVHREKPKVAVVKHRPASRMADHLKICKALLKDPHLSESHACRDAGLKTGSWAGFKKPRFGLGPIDRVQLCKVILELEGAAPVVPASRSGEFVTRGVKNLLVRPELQTKSELPVRIPYSPATIPDKERRHLVASIACGLAAGENGPAFNLRQMIGNAYKLYDELLAQDNARQERVLNYEVANG